MNIPCHVIAGPLGVGKTTAIVDFLQSRMGAENIAVLVNDFGQTGLDAEILHAAGNRVDQCSEAQLGHFREWTAALRPPKLRVVETSFGRLPESLFQLSRGEGASGLIFHRPHMHEESSGGVSAVIEPVSEVAMHARIRNWIQNGIAGAELIRFKAILPTDNGWRLFEIADGSDYVRPMPMAVNCKLDWISRGEVSEAAIRAELASCRLL